LLQLPWWYRVNKRPASFGLPSPRPCTVMAPPAWCLVEAYKERRRLRCACIGKREQERSLACLPLLLLRLSSVLMTFDMSVKDFQIFESFFPDAQTSLGHTEWILRYNSRFGVYAAGFAACRHFLLWPLVFLQCIV
jgi:hypothetical protein